jgi:hypothetical protein
MPTCKIPDEPPLATVPEIYTPAPDGEIGEVIDKMAVAAVTDV